MPQRGGPEQLTEHGAEEMATTFAQASDLAMQLERGRFATLRPVPPRQVRSAPPAISARRDR